MHCSPPENLPAPEPEPAGLDPSQRAAAEALRAGRSLFLAGPGGAGKSHVIREVFRGRDDVALTASTGVAASLLGGRTLHAALGIGLGRTREDVFRGIRRRAKALAKVRAVVVDEATMLDADLFAWIGEALAAHAPTGREGPWGGRQVVLCGDPYQLGPVKGAYFFESPAFREGGFETLALTGAHRHRDADFRALLARARTGDDGAVDQILELARGRAEWEDGIAPTVILPTNQAVDQTNAREFQALGTPVHELHAEDSGPRSLLGVELAPKVLALRVGAQVMVTRNVDVENRICNGTRGVVRAVRDGAVTVLLTDGREVDVARFAFEVREDLARGPPLAVRRQFPLRLAWALTVHKAQGSTLDRVSIDLSRTFAPGQIYTALSRVRDLAGLHVRGRPRGERWRREMVAPPVRALMD